MTGGKKDEFLFAVTILVAALLLWPVWRRSAELGAVDPVSAFVAAGSGDAHCGVSHSVLAPVLFGAVSYAVPQYLEAVGGKSEISELEKQAEIRTIQMEGGSGAEEGLSYLPLSVLQTENPRAQGKGKYYRDLPQVPHRISKEELRAACI